MRPFVIAKNQISFFYHQLLHSKFVKNVLTLSSGTVVAQAISFLSAPIITRLFLPESFGFLATIMAVSGIISVISCLSYERAIVLPNKNFDSAAIIALCLIILCGVTVFTTAGIVVSGGLLNSEIIFNKLGGWQLLIPLFVFGNCFFNIFNQWFIRIKAFKYLAQITIIRSIIVSMSKILVGIFAGAITGGLIGSTLAGVFVGVLFISWRSITIKPSITALMQSVNRQAITVQAIKFKKFPLYSSWNSLLNTFSQEVIVLLFAYFYSPVVVGLYHLAKRMLQQPIFFIAKSVNDVYLQKASQQIANNQDILAGLKKTTLVLALLGVIPFTLIAIFGQPIFRLIFGENWSEAGRYAQVLSPWLFFLFINKPANVLFVVLQKLQFLLGYNIFLTIARIAAIIVGFIFWDSALASLALFSAVGILFNIIFISKAFVLALESRNKKIAA